ncbi:hypothetical protein P152DRAFT_454980 [Eremomyces bilateralis CBS 781.70]|uniref:Uncharacterized protein n=1 Tax=Eremomyces bilateralis CBS 781.70 TaxID=1392243 RepID=A0A6G1GFB6_9PEZI|nr:uncharacterized protein P152DRAFT_454980 [Eremomyces bilateralis CBS 781.70]KAF1816743.1 hypothetical protein P152DRAFT_454980 [Eremomyces bilateralis CBS 781.70]
MAQALRICVPFDRTLRSPERYWIFVYQLIVEWLIARLVPLVDTVTSYPPIT